MIARFSSFFLPLNSFIVHRNMTARLLLQFVDRIAFDSPSKFPLNLKIVPRSLSKWDERLRIVFGFYLSIRFRAMANTRNGVPTHTAELHHRSIHAPHSLFFPSRLSHKDASFNLLRALCQWAFWKLPRLKHRFTGSPFTYDSLFITWKFISSSWIKQRSLVWRSRWCLALVTFSLSELHRAVESFPMRKETREKFTALSDLEVNKKPFILRAWRLDKKLMAHHKMCFFCAKQKKNVVTGFFRPVRTQYLSFQDLIDDNHQSAVVNFHRGFPRAADGAN